MQIETIKITAIIPSPDNPRKVVEDDKLRQMAESIKAHGVLEPLLARPHPTQKGKYDLRAGERRLKAAKLAGLKEVPVLVRPMTDKEALEVTVIENLQREDLKPLEEARGIQTLLDRGWTLEESATQLGRSKQWVAKRASLSGLSETWLGWANDPNVVISDWPISRLEIVARFPAATQERIAKRVDFMMDHDWKCREDNAAFTTADLRRIIADELHIIANAPWKNDMGTLPACPECRKRSDVQPELFDAEDIDPPVYDNEPEGKCVKCGVEASDEEEFTWENESCNLCSACWEKMKPEMRPDAQCLDGDCWKAKSAAYVERRRMELEAEYGEGSTILTTYNCSLPKDSPYEKTAVRNWEVNDAKKGAKGARPVLVVDGPNAGQVKFGMLSDRARTPPGSGGGEPKPKTLKERREGLAKKRLKWITERIIEQVEAKIKEDRTPFGMFGECQILALVLAIGTAKNYPHIEPYGTKSADLWKNYRKFLEPPLGEYEALFNDVFHSALECLLSRLRHTLTIKEPSEPDIRGACLVLHLEFSDLEREASEAIPEPAGWANLKADGTPKTKKATETPKVKKGKAA